MVAVKDEGDKRRTVNGYSHEDDNLCALCASVLDTDKGEASALHATFISQKYSSKKSQGTTPKKAEEVKSETSVREGCQEIRTGEMSADPGGGTCGCAGGGGSCDKTLRSSLKGQGLGSAQIIERYLCYGCRVTVRDLVSKTSQNSCMFVTVGKHFCQLLIRIPVIFIDTF